MLEISFVDLISSKYSVRHRPSLTHSSLNEVIAPRNLSSFLHERKELNVTKKQFPVKLLAQSRNCTLINSKAY